MMVAPDSPPEIGHGISLVSLWVPLAPTPAAVFAGSGALTVAASEVQAEGKVDGTTTDSAH
jgi:hypothetical protein